MVSFIIVLYSNLVEIEAAELSLWNIILHFSMASDFSMSSFMYDKMTKDAPLDWLNQKPSIVSRLVRNKLSILFQCLASNEKGCQWSEISLIWRWHSDIWFFEKNRPKSFTKPKEIGHCNKHYMKAPTYQAKRYVPPPEQGSFPHFVIGGSPPISKFLAAIMIACCTISGASPSVRPAIKVRGHNGTHFSSPTM